MCQDPPRKHGNMMFSQSLLPQNRWAEGASLLDCRSTIPKHRHTHTHHSLQPTVIIMGWLPTSSSRLQRYLFYMSAIHLTFTLPLHDFSYFLSTRLQHPTRQRIPLKLGQLQGHKHILYIYSLLIIVTLHIHGNSHKNDVKYIPSLLIGL